LSNLPPTNMKFSSLISCSFLVMFFVSWATVSLLGAAPLGAFTLLLVELRGECSKEFLFMVVALPINCCLEVTDCLIPSVGKASHFVIIKLLEYMYVYGFDKVIGVILMSWLSALYSLFKRER